MFLAGFLVPRWDSMAKGSLVLCDEVAGILGHVIAARPGQDCLPSFHSFGLYGGKIKTL